jgi:hypothetical protein
MRYLVLILCAATIALIAEEPSALPQEAQATIERYAAEGSKLVGEAEVRRAAARAKLCQMLDTLQAAEGKAGRLESALAVKELRELVASEGAIEEPKPGSLLPKSVARFLESHQAEIAKIDKEQSIKVGALRDIAIKELEGVKIVETKAGRLDAALAVKQMQEQLRSGQAAARATTPTLVFFPDSAIEPSDQASLRRGGAESTIEVILTAVTKDGGIFRTGAGGNGQSLALVEDELWYAIAAGHGDGIWKAPLHGAKPPLHLAVTFKAGEITLWINGAVGKREKTTLEAIGDNGPGGVLGAAGDNLNQRGMPRTSFSGEMAAFRFVDRVLYSAPFKPVFPLPGSEGVRWQVSAEGLASGPLKELPKARIVGPVQVKTR